jgi:hypothetical protein
MVRYRPAHPPCDRLLDEADAVQAQIILAKPSAIGLAAKTYLFLRLNFFGDRAHEGAAVAPGKLFEGEVHPAGDAAFAAAMLRDVVTFLPELAPLAEPVLAAARKQEAQPWGAAPTLSNSRIPINAASPPGRQSRSRLSNSSKPRMTVSLRRGPPFLDRVNGRRLGFRSRRGDRKCPQVRLWAQVWGSVGGTDRGLTI